MSERPTDTRRAAAAHGLGRDAGPRYDGAPAGASRQTVADRAASFRRGAPFLVERATLYDPEPLDPPPTAQYRASSPPRRVLPAALTLLAVVVVAGLAASVLLVRNADVVRHADGQGHDQGTGAGRLDQFSDRALPKHDPKPAAGPQPNSTTITYDLTRRPNEVIVGAWRPRAEEGADPSPPSRPPPSQRRHLPQRFSKALPPVPPEPVTRPVVAAPPRYDAPEPRRRVADGDLPSAASTPAPVAETPAQRSAPNVVARVGRESEPLEELGPPIEIPLDTLALPLRRPAPAEREEAEEADEPRVTSARTRRARLLSLQRRMRREQRHARKRDYNEKQWIPEALYGNRYLGMERLLP